MASHSLQQRLPWCQDWRTCIMVRLGREVRSCKYYIIGKYCRIFRNVDVQDPWQNSENYLVLGLLCSVPLREPTEYLRWSTWLSLCPQPTLRGRTYSLLPYGGPYPNQSSGMPGRTCGYWRTRSCQHESLCVPVSSKKPGPHLTPRLCDQHKP